MRQFFGHQWDPRWWSTTCDVWLCALGTPHRGSIAAQNAPEVNPLSGCVVVPATTLTATCEQCDTPGPSASHSVVEQNLLNVTTEEMQEEESDKI